jgi:uncharacterized protein (TIGR03083 family)
MSREADAFEPQAKELAALLDELSPEDWERTTRLPGYTVKDLVVHTVFALRLREAIARQPFTGSPSRDRVTWWDRDRGDGAQNDETIRSVAAGMSIQEAVEALRAVLDSCADAFRSLPPDAAVGSDDLSVRAGDIAAVSVIEAGVHAMDIGHATLRGERIHPAAAGIVVEVLEGRLGQPLPKRIGWDEKTYILTGSGRRPLSPNERWTLGPLADKFPLLT